LSPSLQSDAVPQPPDHVIRRRRIAALIAIVLAAAGVAVALLLRSPGDVSNPTATFSTQPPAKPAPPRTVEWPTYGFDSARTKWFRPKENLEPPYRRIWSWRGTKLLEFPPVLNSRGLYILDDGGVLRHIAADTGKQVWDRRLGWLAASSPALDRSGRLFAVTLLDNPSAGKGSAWAIDQRSGRVLWRKRLPARAESSPLLADGKVIFGAENGTVYALDPATGKVRWTYSAAGSVKAALALSGGRLLFGDYGGQVQAVSLRTGRRIWAANPGGRFYSTGAIAWGRFYVGNTDGRLYSYTLGGDLAWARQTGAYVYSSPAVADVPGAGPTVYAGSYSGNFHAWDARTGTERWTFAAGGKISGGATVIGRTVWFNDLGNERTIGLDARSGRRNFDMGTGAFNPAVTDGRTMYLVGYTNIYGFVPRKGRPR